ncbi:MAG: MOSC domain-containing protein [Chloroflexota bacterium]|nr:MAG: MOSC domain-containing protein [Chloroflexota bacterium]
MSANRFYEAARALVAEGGRTTAIVGALAPGDERRIVWDDWTIHDVLGHVEASHLALLRGARGDVSPAPPGGSLADVNEQRRQDRKVWSFDHLIASLDTTRAVAIAHLRSLSDADWGRVIRTSSGREWTLGPLTWQMSNHERSHREEIERSFGRLAPGGRVRWLSVSAGGVPKRHVYSAIAGELGLSGDAHNSPNHGGPTAALCLFSAEVIEALRQEGHPIAPGTAGENLSIGGLDWPTVVPGDRYRVGGAVIEITRYTVPCQKIAGSFKDGVFDRINQELHPGQARVYARVVEPGLIATGDAVVRL